VGVLETVLEACPLLERGLGNILASATATWGGEPVPALLRDILAARQLEHVLGTPAVTFLQVPVPVPYLVFRKCITSGQCSRTRSGSVYYWTSWIRIRNLFFLRHINSPYPPPPRRLKFLLQKLPIFPGLYRTIRRLLHLFIKQQDHSRIQ
jgi:hypothetical protein